MSQTSSFSPRKLLPITIIASGTFAWWFLITMYLEEIYSSFADQFWIYVLAIAFYGSGAISAIPGSMIGERINRRKFLLFCFTFGVLATLLLLLVGQNLVFALLTSTLLGISLGLGFPSCIAIVADCTTRKKERDLRVL